jgi:hypothetical protein
MQKSTANPGHPELVGGRADGTKQRPRDVEGVLKGVGNPMKVSVVMNEGPVVEGMQIEGFVVQLQLGLGIGRQHYLKPSIQMKALHLIGANPSPHPIGRLYHLHGEAASMHLPRTG